MEVVGLGQAATVHCRAAPAPARRGAGSRSSPRVGRGRTRRPARAARSRPGRRARTARSSARFPSCQETPSPARARIVAAALRRVSRIESSRSSTARAVAACSSLILAFRPCADPTVRSGLKPKLTASSMRSWRARSRVKTAPPSPIAKGFVAWKETTSTSPWAPTGRPSSATAPNPAAESTTRGTPALRQALSQRVRVSSGGWGAEGGDRENDTEALAVPQDLLEASGVQVPVVRRDVREPRGETRPDRGLSGGQEREGGHQRLGPLRSDARAFENGGDRHHQAERAAGDRNTEGADLIAEAIAQQPPAGAAVAEPSLLAREVQVAIDLRRRGKGWSLEGDHRRGGRTPRAGTLAAEDAVEPAEIRARLPAFHG